MGDYADGIIDDGIFEDFGSILDTSYGMGRLGFKQPKKCRSCGYGGLYWGKEDNKWRLYHYTLLYTMKQPEFVLHRCGFKSDGTPVEKSNESLE